MKWVYLKLRYERGGKENSFYKVDGGDTCSLKMKVKIGDGSYLVTRRHWNAFIMDLIGDIVLRKLVERIYLVYSLYVSIYIYLAK
jgi:hypothetical protein